MIQLDERLSAAAELAGECAVFYDVGSNHGFLGAHLLQSGACRRAVLCDISDDALNRARETVEKEGLQDRTQLVVADGLRGLFPTAQDAVAVCGMGARTVMHIVERALPCPLVAQANVETPLLRRHLERIGMHVVQEMPVRAAGRFYLVLRAEPGQGERPMSEYEAYIGPALLRDHPAGTEDYLAWRLGVETRALEGLRTGRDAARLREAEQRVAFVRRAIEEGKK